MRFYVLLGPRGRGVVDPVTGLLWRFPTRDEALFFLWSLGAAGGAGLLLLNGRQGEDPGTTIVSEFDLA